MWKHPFVFSVALSFIAAGLFLLLGDAKWFGDLYTRPKLLGVGAFIYAGLILLPLAILKRHPRYPKKKKSVGHLSKVLTVGFLMSGAGDLGLYELYRVGFEYDKLVHFIFPLLATVVLTLFSIEWFGWSFRKSLKFIVTFILLASLTWEGIEYFSDELFETTLLGFKGKYVEIDTKLDILADLLGIIAGGGVALIMRKSRLVRSAEA